MTQKLSQEQMYEIISDKTEQLPSLPSIVYELLTLTNDPMTSLSQIETLISKDPSLATQVLKVANSAFYGIPGGASTINRAITYLGIDHLYQIAITSSVFENLDTTDGTYFNVKEFWKHSFVTAITAEQMAIEFNYEDRPIAFLAGLLHDIGKIVFHNFNPESWNQICNFAQEKKLSIHQAELSLNALMHSEAGFLLAKKWNLPDDVCATIRHHHDYDQDLTEVLTDEQIFLNDIIGLSNVLTHTLNLGNSGYNIRIDVPLEIVERLDISRKRWVDFLMGLRDHLESAATVMETLVKD